MEKVIVAGCRDYLDYEHIKDILDKEKDITEIVCGGASGVDSLGKKYAETNNIKVKMFPAEWTKYGKSAGPIRNKQMADYADRLIAFWDGKSRGTSNMIETMRSLGKEVEIIDINEPKIHHR